MLKPQRLLTLVAFGFSLSLGCGAAAPSTGTGHAGSTGTAGAGGSSTGTGGGAVAGAGGDAVGTGGSGVAGATATAGSGGSTGAGGTGGATSGSGGTGVGGTGGGAGSVGGTGAAGTSGGHVRTGMSKGCTMPPPSGDSTSSYKLHEIQVPNVNPIYATGGMYAQSSGKYNFTLRPYALKLPTNYDPNKPYAVAFGGGGCGGSAQGFAGGPNGGFDFAPNGTVISVGLSYITTCFSDGGPDIGNRPDTPEVPYFRAVMADIEAKYCIDLSQVFVAGFSSGAWEAYTLGCAAADLIRGIGADEGGMRAVRPPCAGPVAALLVAGTADTENPIGPLAPTDGAYKRLGSPGSGPGRDDILARNGCTGTTTAAWDSAFPACVKYTGCPAAYPVVWCELPNVGHNDSTYNGINYSPGGMWKLLGSLTVP